VGQRKGGLRRILTEIAPSGSQRAVHDAGRLSQGRRRMKPQSEIVKGGREPVVLKGSHQGASSSQGSYKFADCILAATRRAIRPRACKSSRRALAAKSSILGVASERNGSRSLRMRSSVSSNQSSVGSSMLRHNQAANETRPRTGQNGLPPANPHAAATLARVS
jgi:hypothetical protein